MFNILINKFKIICPFYSPCHPVLCIVSSRILIVKRAIFWLFLVELFMRYSLGSQLSSSRYFIRILKLNSVQMLDVINIYLKREKSPQSALETILTIRLIFIGILLTIIWHKYMNHVFLPSHLENRLNVPPQFLASVQQDSSKGKENICSTLEHFASRSPSLIKLLQTKSIQANFGVFTHHYLHKNSVHQNLEITMLCKLKSFSSPFTLEFVYNSHIKPC